MLEHIDTVIVGGGQGGLATSYHLTQQGIPHVVLEKKDRPAPTWEDERWDSFTLVTPNWSFRLPGAEYRGDRPDDFMSRDEIVARFRDYVEQYRLPLRYDTEVVSIERADEAQSLRVRTRDAGFLARNVVVATGLFQFPRLHPAASRLPSDIVQLHSSQYRNPSALPPGNVLVVGSSQSGCQIANELMSSGRQVYLSVGASCRLPRRYRGHDCTEWLERLGLWDKTADTLPSPNARFAPSPQLAGRHDGEDLDLHRFAAEGMRLLGHLENIVGDHIHLRDDLAENLEKADRLEATFLAAVDQFVQAKGLDAPAEHRPIRDEGYEVEPVRTLSLLREGISSVIWATGYGFDFGMVRFPVFDSDGYPQQRRGVTNVPGLYFVGLPWLHKQKSGLIAGVGEDAEYVASSISERAIRSRESVAIDSVA
ncbi:MAG TPA: NAD(P)-binding domain-containing protein [Burkholderiaceae bacterium]|nr:NAD(P)-binding domain-containing protein [Burkholderiaceae bacterium]